MTVFLRCIKLDAKGPVERWDGPARNDVKHLEASSQTWSEEIREYDGGDMFGRIDGIYTDDANGLAMAGIGGR